MLSNKPKLYFISLAKKALASVCPLGIFKISFSTRNYLPLFEALITLLFHLD